MKRFKAPTPGDQFTRQRLWGAASKGDSATPAGYAHTVGVKKRVAKKALNSPGASRDKTLTTEKLNDGLEDPLTKYIIGAHEDVKSLGRLKAEFKAQK